MIERHQIPDAAARGSLTSSEFREIAGYFASGVTVITTVHEGVRCGATASAVSSLSLEPPMMLICLNRSAATAKAVTASGRFIVNILAEDQPDIAMRFASSGINKFEGLDVGATAWGGPLLSQALANIDCRVVEQVSGGTHTVFLAEVETAVRQLGAPLAYFRGKFGRLTTDLDELAYHELRERLLRRAVPIGVPLNLEEIATGLGVPRGAIYHCLARCVHEGLVERSASGSFVVPAVTIEGLLDALTALFGIWLGAIQLTIHRLPDSSLQELHGLLDALRPGEHGGTVNSSLAFLLARGRFVGVFLEATASVTMQEAFSRADVQSMVAHCWSGPGALAATEYAVIHDGFSKVLRAVEARDPAAVTGAIGDLHAVTRELFTASFRKHDRFH